MKRFSVFFVIFLFCLLLPFGTMAASDVPAAVLKAKESVLRIESSDADGISTGSGFIINNADDTYIVTNYHVVKDGSESISVWINKEQKLNADLILFNEQRDLAVLKLVNQIDAKPLPLSTEATQGTSVYAIGYPGAADYLYEAEAHTSEESTITDGLISSVRTMKAVEYGVDVKVLQISAPINPGNSGGPLLNARGGVLGITSFGVLDAQGIYGAIDISELILILQGTQITYSLNKSGDSSWLLYLFTGIAAISTILAVIIIIVKRRKHTKSANTAKKRSRQQTLEDYLKDFAYPVDSVTAVSMIMPLALALRDKHNQGAVFLKLSPRNVLVTRQGCVLNTDTADYSFLYPGFTSPEQMQSRMPSIQSDIYSLCALFKLYGSIELLSERYSGQQQYFYDSGRSIAQGRPYGNYRERYERRPKTTIYVDAGVDLRVIASESTHSLGKI